MLFKLSAQTEMINTVIDKLVPSNDQLLAICEQLKHELDLGLHNLDSCSLKLYPTFVSRNPSGTERGKYLALDLGGTNFRILLINLHGGRQSTVVNQTFALSRELMQGSGVQLFDYIARCLYNFVEAQHIKHEKLSLGFTFSFPCKQVGLKKAYLTNWTKGFCCSDTIGKDVCEMLQNSLKKYHELYIDVSAIVNDTTGTLTSCAYMNPDCQVGVIIGTGVNLCYMESDPKIFNGCQMIINTELGAFGSSNSCLNFLQTSWDKQIDSRSLNPGQQIFEKMVSGMYMGEIVRTIMADLISCNVLFNAQLYGPFLQTDSFPTSLISKVVLDQVVSQSFENTRSVLLEMGIVSPTQQECKSLHLICTNVSRRSAYLVSAAIATILRKINKPSIVVGVDGTVFRRHPHFESMMYTKINELIPLMPGFNSNTRFQLMLSEDGSGRGAALVAAVESQPLPELFPHTCRHPICLKNRNRQNLVDSMYYSDCKICN